MKKRAIPQVPRADQPRQAFDQALKENMEILMGQRVAPVKPLDSAATLAQTVAKLNELLIRLQ